MKKKKFNSKLLIKKSKVASLDHLNALKGGENTIAPDRCDIIITMTCPSDGCPPTGGTGGTVSNNCPPDSTQCPSADTYCRCDSIITMAGVTGC